MAKIWLDGSLAMFAPEGDGCLQRAKREDAGRFSKEGKSLDDFWYFSSVKSTGKEKYLYDSIRRQQAIPCLGDADRIRLRESVNSRPTI